MLSIMVSNKVLITQLHLLVLNLIIQICVKYYKHSNKVLIIIKILIKVGYKYLMKQLM